MRIDFGCGPGMDSRTTNRDKECRFRAQKLVQDLAGSYGEQRRERINRLKQTVDELCPTRSECVRGASSRHYKTPEGTVNRFHVPAHLVPWSVPFKEYNPVHYTWKNILDNRPEWADPDITDTKSFEKIKFNEIDGCIDRTSFLGKYDVVDRLPRNPTGRTGIAGRGMLGKWGPNHAADPIVTRWQRDDEGNIVHYNGDLKNPPILQFVAIRRKDTKEWAIPGGMVDANEEVSSTLKREFNEEALNSLEEGEGKEQTKKDIQNLFKNGKVVYEGYVDDPRNTDNAWIETVACNFHDDDGTTVGRIPLKAGDDASAVRWLSIGSSLRLYASHARMIEKVCRNKGAYFPDI